MEMTYSTRAARLLANDNLRLAARKRVLNTLYGLKNELKPDHSPYDHELALALQNAIDNVQIAMTAQLRGTEKGN